MTQRIFITGGASGLGLAIAEHYAQAGWQVALGDINAERLEQAGTSISDIHAKRLAEADAAADMATGEIITIPCDVTKISDWKKALEHIEQTWGGLDILVNNAGVATAGSITDHSLADWEWVTNINLLGVVRGCKTFTPLFQHQGHGHIINIASMAGLIHPPLMASYNATKAAVVALSETLEAELAVDNIGVTVVCPGFFRTNLNESMRSDLPGMDQLLNKLFERSPLTASDVAKAIKQGVDNQQFFVLPHAEGRKTFMLKRLIPHKQYAKLVQKQSDWLMKRKPNNPTST